MLISRGRIRNVGNLLVATAFTLPLLLLVNGPHLADAAFTLKVASGNDTVERNVAGTWCFYPTFPTTSSTSSADDSDDPNLDNIDCSSMSDPQKGDMRAVLRAHLTQRSTDSLSIAYYSASLTRLGGAKYLVDTVPGSKVYLCVSGQDVTERDSDRDGILDSTAGGRYKTICEVAERDNEFGLLDAQGDRRKGKTVCAVEVAQRNVTDGCYIPSWMQVLDEAGAANGLSVSLKQLAVLPTSLGLISLLGWL